MTPSDSQNAKDLSAPRPMSYELRIGVTGHCALDETDELRNAIGSLVENRIQAILESACANPKGPHGSERHWTDAFYDAATRSLSIATGLVSPALRVCSAGLISWPTIPYAPSHPDVSRLTRLDLTVVTCLAPGADLLIAEEIVERVRAPEHRNRVLEAVLPFPAEFYIRKFEDDVSLRRFHDLLKLDGGGDEQSGPVVVQPDVDGPRRPAFAAASRYMVDASELLIAIWDPTREDLEGGTGETVLYAAEAGRVILWLDPRNIDAGVRSLRIRKGDEPPGPLGLAVVDAPHRSKHLSRGFHRLAAFNRDAAWESKAFSISLAEERERLLAAARDRLPHQVAEAILTDLIPRYAYADQLAIRYANLRNFVARLLPFFSAAAVTFIAVQILFLPEHYWLAVVEIVILAIAYASYRLNVREAWHEKWLNDRHLAEHFRSLLYTGLLEEYPSEAGLNANALPFYHPTNVWFESTFARLRGGFRHTLRDFHPDDHLDGVVAFIREGWIRAEREHHERVRNREQLRARHGARFPMIALSCVAVVAAAHALGVGHSGPPETPPFERIDLWIALLAIAIPAWGAALQAVGFLGDAPRLAERSALMVDLLVGIEERLTKIESRSELDAVLSEARRAIDLETDEWAASLRTRTPRPQG